MAVKLRLRREGTDTKPTYRVVAADARSPRNGRFIEIFGEYRPLEDPSYVRIDEDRALHWLNHGAQPTDAVKHLLRITGVWERFKPEDTPTRQRTQDKVKLSKKARAKAAEAAEAGAASEDAPADTDGGA